MRRETKRSGNANCSRFSREKKRAFTLVELLAALTILAVFAGALSTIPVNRRSPEKEAEHLARWLTHLTVMSNRSGRPFRIICPGNVALDYVEASWQHPTKKETHFSSGGATFTGYRGRTLDCIYSPQWGTLTPTATIKVTLDKKEHYVIVSQHGKVRTSKTPPPE